MRETEAETETERQTETERKSETETETETERFHYVHCIALIHVFCGSKFCFKNFVEIVL